MTSRATMYIHNGWGSGPVLQVDQYWSRRRGLTKKSPSQDHNESQYPMSTVTGTLCHTILNTHIYTQFQCIFAIKMVLGKICMFKAQTLSCSTIYDIHEYDIYHVKPFQQANALH